MKLSQRMKKLPPQFFATLVRNVNLAKAEGRDIINLGQGNPDQPTPPHIVAKLQESAASPKNHGYGPFTGLDTFKAAVATFYQREYNVTLDPTSEVAILFGSKTGLVELPLCLMDPGDAMLLPDPGYPDYLSGPALFDTEIISMPLEEKNDFLPDYTRLSEADKKRAEWLYLNYPNNPTGAIATPAFFAETVALAKKHTIGVLHDFAYGAIGFDGVKPPSFLETPGAKEVGIELYTLSKTYNMAGWRVGFAVGNATAIEAINLVQDHLFVSLFPAIQEAAIEALLGDQQNVTDLVARYEKRRNALISDCQAIGWEVAAPQGSFFAWLPVPNGYTSTDFTALLLNEADVAVADGSGFGTYGEGYIRVGLLIDEKRIAEALTRIAALHLFD
ncbi:pyridoxal phosphate-dependent aminotransferase [Brochothrix thermosphacta]|uniref:pyridoxal phosphate-dependent aminotransferase n=1 Tax=Brochothrix thermosphacta TaxID=2756 RepID=UPI00083F58CD|nr:pyridoxal phosphate-dependent aminotransferase [Brochothrix thermosphacta]ODJ66686.1 hypothetical protein BFR35_05775 [Brochothrix thermosphacta]ODJ67309.1 hypothetical protein BFR37_06425 [Brochothrix thermosphacta]SPN72278.1 methionine-glutamine aminotransferase [Brochothrix thermosphacta]